MKTLSHSLSSPKSGIRLLLLSLISLALIGFAQPSPASASNWYPEAEYNPDKFSLNFKEPWSVSESTFTSTVYESKAAKYRLERLAKYDCQSLQTYPCVASDKIDMQGTVLAPVCRGAETNCIREFFAEVDGSKVPAQFLGYVGTKEFPAAPALGIRGRAVSASLWDLPGVVHEGGTSTYLVSVSYFLTSSGKEFKTYDFNTFIVPYVTERGANYKNQEPVIDNKAQGSAILGYSAPQVGCVWERSGECGKAHRFPEGAKFGLEIKFQKDLATWFKARMEQTDLSVRSASSQDNIIRISGSPIEVPIFSYSLDKETFPSQISKFMAKNKLPVENNTGYGLANDGDLAVPLVDLYRPYVNDTAAATLSVWTFSNIATYSLLSCFDRGDEILGLVTTNSMAYQGEPPVFRKGSLEYQVAGMHYLPGGTELALGSYELIIKSSVASCLYGFGSAPISANVSVVNEGGTKVFATTTVSNKNGWLKLSAKGFTFSKKIIKVKITKAKKK